MNERLSRENGPRRLHRLHMTGDFTGFIGGGDGEAGKLNSKRDPGDFEASKVVSV